MIPVSTLVIDDVTKKAVSCAYSAVEATHATWHQTNVNAQAARTRDEPLSAGQPNVGASFCSVSCPLCPCFLSIGLLVRTRTDGLNLQLQLQLQHTQGHQKAVQLFFLWSQLLGQRETDEHHCATVAVCCQMARSICNDASWPWSALG